MAGKTILITGASSGFGAAAARLFAEGENRLVLASRRYELFAKLGEELSVRVPVQCLQLDVRQRTAVEAALAALPAGFNEIDLLVNNAGLALGLEPAQQASLDDWDTMIDTNIKGLTYLTRCLLPGMV